MVTLFDRFEGINEPIDWEIRHPQHDARGNLIPVKSAWNWHISWVLFSAALREYARGAVTKLQIEGLFSIENNAPNNEVCLNHFNDIINKIDLELLPDSKLKIILEIGDILTLNAVESEPHTDRTQMNSRMGVNG